MKKKLQLFVSSTFEDLRMERQLVIEAILEMGHLPAGMEYFISDNVEQFKLIKQWIDESDAYILICGGRYGTIDESDPAKRSYTHLEFDYAKETKKPVKVLRLSDSFLQDKKKNGIYSNDDLMNEQLKNFRNSLPVSNNVSSISDIKSVAKTIIGGFNYLIQKENAGWVKSQHFSNLIELHPNNTNLAEQKSIQGKYHVYYFSKYNNRFVHSILKLSIDNNFLSAEFHNDINEKNRALYNYNGKFEIFDDFLYLELKSNTDNEKTLISVKLLPGKLKVSIGIIVAQGSLKQAVATTCIISKNKITDQSVLEKFRERQSAILTENEMLLINDKSISDLINNIASSKNKKG